MLIIDLFLLGLALFIFFFFVYGFYVEWKGAPFVPTSAKAIETILKNADLKPGQTFYELGCGDGRVVFAAVQKFGQQGIGIELHPWLLFFCRIKIKMLGLKNIAFRQEDVLQTDLSKAEVIYLFMGRKINHLMSPRIKKYCHKNTLIISRGFTLPSFETKLKKTLPDKYFPVYYYRI